MGFKSPSWRSHHFGSQCFWFAFSFRIKQANLTLAGFKELLDLISRWMLPTIHFLDQPKLGHFWRKSHQGTTNEFRGFGSLDLMLLQAKNQ